MRKLLFSAAALAGLGALSSPAFAVAITPGSTINFSGQSTCTATSCTFGNAIVTSGTGSFSTFTFGNAATFSTLTYSPFTPQLVYSSSQGGLTTTFSVTSNAMTTSSVVNGLTLYNIVDNGIATLTGFDSTAGSFAFSAQQNGTVQGSFSATTTAAAASVPEPVSIALLGGGLAAFGLIRRKRS